MTIDILRRTGGWAVELMLPITFRGKAIDCVEIRTPDLSQIARWGRGEIHSSMAMLSELSDVPEVALLSLRAPDTNRVLMAFFNCIPDSMQSDFTAGRVPLVTPKELLPADQGHESDPLDPRFPKAVGPVQRFESPPRVVMPAQQPADDGVQMAPPDIMRAVVG